MASLNLCLTNDFLNILKIRSTIMTVNELRIVLLLHSLKDLCV